MDKTNPDEPRGPDGTFLPQDWDTAYRKYFRFWTNLARTMNLAPEDAQDVVHGVIATIIGNERIQFASSEHLRNYVSRSILNRALQLKRRNDRSVSWEEHVDLLCAVHLDVSKMDSESLKTALREAMRRLPERDFRTIKLRFFSGLRFTEISSLLSVPISTLKSREDHGLKIIREWLFKRGIRGGDR